MSLLDSIKHAVMEDDAPEKTDKPGKKEQAVAKPTPVFVQEGVPLVADTDDSFYKQLTSRTSFESTDVGTKVYKYLNAMASAPLDQLSKLKTALAQSKGLDNLTDDEIMQAFADMKNSLDEMAAKFSDNVDRTKAEEVDARQAEITNVTEEIAKRQQELTHLQERLDTTTAGMSEWKDKITHVRSQFASALQRRTTAIEQERAKMSALLKG